MNGSSSNFQGGSGSDDLRGQIQGLRNTLTLTLLFVFIFSFSVNVFLYHQAKILKMQVGEEQQIISNFQNGGAQQVIDFWSKLNDYAKTHPDFAPVIDKYKQFISVHSNANATMMKK